MVSRGRESVVVLLHGMGTGARAWTPQMAELSPARRTVAVSLPGYDDAPGPFSIPAACDRVREAIDGIPGGT